MSLFLGERKIAEIDLPDLSLPVQSSIPTIPIKPLLVSHLYQYFKAWNSFMKLETSFSEYHKDWAAYECSTLEGPFVKGEKSHYMGHHRKEASHRRK